MGRVDQSSGPTSAQLLGLLGLGIGSSGSTGNDGEDEQTPVAQQTADEELDQLREQLSLATQRADDADRRALNVRAEVERELVAQKADLDRQKAELNQRAAAVSQQETQKSREAAMSTFGDGLYKVGEDILPGQYKTDGPSSGSWSGACYWSRNKDASGEFASIITNEIIQGPARVSVKAGEYVGASGGCTWTKVA